MTQDHSKADQGIPSLAYRSEQLAALLEVFSLGSSGTFIRELALSAGVDLDSTSVAAITFLARDGDQRASALAHRLRVGASALSKISNRLERIGLIERQPDVRDARATLLRLTPAGAQAAFALVRAGVSMMDAIIGDWSASDRDHFDRLLRRFRDDAMLQATRAHTTTIDPVKKAEK